jgi:hypothetical protein
MSSDDRERDAEIAEHVLGWERTYNGHPDVRPQGWLLLAPADRKPDWWEPVPYGTDRSKDFWLYMDYRIPKYSADPALIWQLITRIVPQERPLRAPDSGSMIVHPIPPERWHTVHIWTGTSTIFMDWNIEIRDLDSARALVGASGPNLPQVVARAIHDLIRVEQWVGGTRQDGG